MYTVYPDSSFEVRRDGGKWGKSRFLTRAFIGAFSPDGSRMAVGASRGVVCPNCAEGLYVMSSDMAHNQYLPTPQLGKVIQSPGNLVYSKDSRDVFSIIREKDGTSSIWRVPINGDAEKRVLHLTDPSRQFYRTTLDVDSKNFYFTIGDRQSDIWTMELKKQ
ncbi:MAG TPA: hypothetical protein VJB15_10285 [Rhodothermia bacterium]|nr:hypothetical protein [Rhodothermia bacterium]